MLAGIVLILSVAGVIGIAITRFSPAINQRLMASTQKRLGPGPAEFKALKDRVENLEKALLMSGDD